MEGSRIRQTKKKEDEERLKDKELIEWLIKQNEQKEAALRRKDLEIDRLTEKIKNLEAKLVMSSPKKIEESISSKKEVPALGL